MTPEAHRLISLFLSNDPSNQTLAFELEQSLGMDLSDFWLGLQALSMLHNHRNEVIYQKANEPDRAFHERLLQHYQYLRGYRLQRQHEIVFLNRHFQPGHPFRFSPDTYLFDHIRSIRFWDWGHLPVQQLEWLKAFRNVEIFRYSSHNGHRQDLADWLDALIPHFPNLRVLQIDEGQTSRVPESLRPCAQLEVLNLTGNQIREIPDWIGDFTQLRSLFLAGNPLTDPESVLQIFRRLPALKWISLFNRHKQAITALDECRAITFTEDSPHDAQNLAEKQLLLRFMPKLERLALHQSPSPLLLEQLPDSVPGLDDLQFKSGGLTDLPAAVLQWKNLKKLHLPFNQLKRVPEMLRSFSQLESLDLSFNPLEALPDWLGEMRQLKFLHLKNCQLKQLPESLKNLDQLRVLRVSGNALPQMPDWLFQLKNLQRLDWHDTGLERVPEAIEQLQQLETLHLDKNPLTALPEALARLPKLWRLSLELLPQMNWRQAFGVLKQCKSLRHVPWMASLDLLKTEKITQADGTKALQYSLKEEALERISFSPHGDNFPLPRWQHWKQVFDTLRHLPELRALRFQGVYFNDRAGNFVWERLAELEQLEELELAWCSSPGIRTRPQDYPSHAMPQLRRLILRSIRLDSTVPPFIRCLTSLRELAFTHNNQFKELPDFLLRLQQLEKLDIRLCSLRQLPDWLGELPFLQELCIAGNHLEKLPRFILERNSPFRLVIGLHQQGYADMKALAENPMVTVVVG